MVFGFDGFGYLCWTARVIGVYIRRHLFVANYGLVGNSC